MTAHIYDLTADTWLDADLPEDAEPDPYDPDEPEQRGYDAARDAKWEDAE